MRQSIPMSFAARASECECLAELTRFPEMAEQMRRLAALYRRLARLEANSAGETFVAVAV